MKDLHEITHYCGIQPKKMSTGFVHKGDKITFVGSKYEALSDCVRDPEVEEIMECPCYLVFTKNQEGEIVLFSLLLETDDETCTWFPADGWIEEEDLGIGIRQAAEAASIEIIYNKECGYWEAIKEMKVENVK